MKEAELHDSLNLIDDDMIEAVDALRMKKRKQKTQWFRWGTLAACVCLVIVAAAMLWKPNMEFVGNSTGKAVGGESTDGYANTVYTLYNAERQQIGELELYSVIAQTEDSIIYTKGQGKSNKLDFCRYILENGESITLGTVENECYDAMNPLYLDEHLYLFVSTGDLFGEYTTHLMDIDLEKNSMSTISSEENGYPYSTMTAVGTRVLIAKGNHNGTSELVEYDPATQKSTTLFGYRLDENNRGEEIKGITSDEETVSLAVLKTEDEAELRIDVYDHEMNFLRSVDLSMLGFDLTEKKDPIRCLVFTEESLYYENYSRSIKFLGRIEGELIPYLNLEEEGYDLFTSVFTSVSDAKTPLFYEMFDFDGKLIRWNTKTGTLEQAAFPPNDEEYQVQSVYTGPDGKLLLCVKHEEDRAVNPLPRELYCIDLDDLTFESLT